jgi:hypothetical protein
VADYARFPPPQTPPPRQVRTVSAAFLARWMDLRGMTVEDLSLGGDRDSQPGGTVVSVRKPPARGGRAGAVSGRAPAPVPAAPAIGGGTGQRYAAAAAAAAAPAAPALARGGAGGPADRAAARQAAAVGASADAEAAAASLEPSSWWQQYWWTFHREIIMITRNPADVAGRTLTNTWVAATMGLMYYDIPSDTGALRGKVNMLLNILAFFCLMPYISMSLYTASKQFYLADVSAKLYTPSAYYLAKVGGGAAPLWGGGWGGGLCGGAGGVGAGLGAGNCAGHWVAAARSRRQDAAAQSSQHPTCAALPPRRASPRCLPPCRSSWSAAWCSRLCCTAWRACATRWWRSGPTAR